jgi:hypothetical protein
MYTVDHIQSLPALGAIENMKILRPFDEYLRAPVDVDSGGSYENLALIQDFRLGIDGVMVPLEVYEHLATKYGVDVPVYRVRNPHSESWRSELSDKYILQYEEVRLLL